jgi:dihydroneopterin aldolase
MLTVSLSGVKFKAPIGLYPQEALTQNDIEINISVSIPSLLDELPLIDYTKLHQFAMDAVLEPTALLETIVQRIVYKIESVYPGSKITVAVRKLHPPMQGQIDYSEVKWES